MLAVSACGGQAVYEEIPPAPGGKSKKRLGRYLAQVLTPARPIYMHGMVDRSDRPQAREASYPILGVTAGVSGFKVTCVVDCS